MPSVRLPGRLRALQGSPSSLPAGQRQARLHRPNEHRSQHRVRS
ncbi:hypothetical protein LINGRAHAP2_LOCUS16833 [Linum grandiflorum]